MLAQQGDGDGGRRSEPARAPTPRDIAALADLGIGVWRWLSTRASRWRPMCRFTSAIRRVLGNAARNENTNGLLRQYLPKKADSVQLHVNRTWTKSRCASISAHARPWALKLRRVDYRPVLHRPLETTPSYRELALAICGRPDFSFTSIAATKSLEPNPHRETVLIACVKGTSSGCTRPEASM